jgi:hypothetical protein
MIIIIQTTVERCVGKAECDDCDDYNQDDDDDI